MRPVGETPTAEDYRELAEREALDSPTYAAWAVGVAADPEVLELVGALPAAKRQPNLVFAAARRHGAEITAYDDVGGLREVLLGRWEEVRETVMRRSTQTNEVGRCATLLPALAQLRGPLALLEVGASAGLCLFPDRYSYRWTGSQNASLDPPTGPSKVIVDCVVAGDPPLPATMPEVVWRGGVDLHPLDVRDRDAMAWLATLVWPEHEDRRVRLAAAIELVGAEPPSIRTGNLVEELPGLVDTVPGEATLVVFHSAVVAYLSAPERAHFESMARAIVRAGRGHWLSNEGPRVLPSLLPGTPADPVVGPAPFVLALDGRPVGWTHGHGRALQWCDSGAVDAPA